MTPLPKPPRRGPAPRRYIARRAVVLTWTPRNRGLYVYRGNLWATGCGWWRTSK